MKTKADGVPKAFEPFQRYEVDLIPSILPTFRNVKRLAKSLGRSENAIHMIYNYAYSGRWLKRDLSEMADHQDNVVTKIATAKKRAGLAIGYQP